MRVLPYCSFVPGKFKGQKLSELSDEELAEFLRWDAHMQTKTATPSFLFPAFRRRALTLASTGSPNSNWSGAETPTAQSRPSSWVRKIPMKPSQRGLSSSLSDLPHANIIQTLAATRGACNV